MRFQDEIPGPVERPRVGFALGSGAACGWAHIGVLRGLEAAGIVPDVILWDLGRRAGWRGLFERPFGRA